MITQTVGTVSQALGELAAQITEAKVSNPLAPITVLVPSHAAGLDVTRYLGRTSTTAPAASASAPTRSRTSRPSSSPLTPR